MAPRHDRRREVVAVGEVAKVETTALEVLNQSSIWLSQPAWKGR
jgi:hypothetical protein